MKMSADKRSVGVLTYYLNTEDVAEDAEVVLAVPSCYLDFTRKSLDSKFAVGAQNCYSATHGQFTGELSPTMLGENGATWVILGQHERRHIFGESHQMIGQKVANAIKGGLSVVACIGETLAERTAGQTDQVLCAQLSAIATHVTDWSKVAIAYEPVWAISQKSSPTDQQIQQTHASIRRWLVDNTCEDDGNTVRILYGGPVTSASCKHLGKLRNVDGFLTGTGPLSQRDVINIINAREQRPTLRNEADIPALRSVLRHTGPRQHVPNSSAM